MTAEEWKDMDQSPCTFKSNQRAYFLSDLNCEAFPFPRNNRSI